MTPLPKATTALTEGCDPEGQKLNMGVITATVAQYGGFIELSDMLLLSAIDNNLVQATKLLGSQAGRTLDTITREVLERRHQRAVRRGPGWTAAPTCAAAARPTARTTT